MAFMQKQITNKRTWYEIETEHGTWFIDTIDAGNPAMQIGLEVSEFNDMSDEAKEVYQTLLDYVEGTQLLNVSLKVGFGARLSAPGYMDCTDWSVFGTVSEAKDYLQDLSDYEEVEG